MLRNLLYFIDRECSCVENHLTSFCDLRHHYCYHQVCLALVLLSKGPYTLCTSARKKQHVERTWFHEQSQDRSKIF